jgi:RNA polymerase sigma-70 factor (ECF subfamily)
MDRKLVDETLLGDHHAFNRLIERHSQMIYTYIARKIRYPTDVEDFVQEVFLVAFSQISRLQDRDQFSSWLRGIADNLIRMWYRRWYAQLRWEDMIVHEGDDGNIQDDHLDEQEIRMALRAAIGHLTAIQQEMLSYHYFKGYTYEETADLLGLRVNTVRSRLQKARTHLKKEMIEMQDKVLPSPEFTLDREDLNALRWATKFASKDPNRPVLQSVYLDIGGKIVSTDGSRLFLRTIESLKSLSTPVLVGPWGDTEALQAESATLELGETDAKLKLAKGMGYVIPIMEGPYVKYEQVIPPDGPIRATVAFGDLLDTIEQIVPQLEDRHPEDPQSKWTYQPQVEIRLSRIDQTLSLLTTSKMGYYLREEENSAGDVSEGGAVWTFRNRD